VALEDADAIILVDVCIALTLPYIEPARPCG